MEQVILIWNNLNMKKEGEKGEPTSKIFFNQYRIFSQDMDTNSCIILSTKKKKYLLILATSIIK